MIMISVVIKNNFHMFQNRSSPKHVCCYCDNDIDVKLSQSFCSHSYNSTLDQFKDNMSRWVKLVIENKNFKKDINISQKKSSLWHRANK